VEFEVLGPLRVVVAGRAVSIASGRQRAVLAVLVLSANRRVSADRLVELVWGGHPASSAQNLVRTYIWRLRALLIEDSQPRVVTEPGGYLLRVEPGELDLAEFERLLGEGKAAHARDESSAAAECLRDALALWRGEPFSDVALHGGDLAAEIQRLNEERVAALEERVEADLALGRHEDLIGELQQLTASHPLRERITGQLMLACYRSSRQADALTAYGRLRTRLAEELGMDPGRELQQLHERILRADPELLTGGAVRGVSEQSAPRQLPAAPGHFAGRTEELKALTSVVEHAGQSGGTVVISAIDGMAGIGKTALAIHAAHRLAEAYPDGQLFIDLHGYTQGQRPRTADQALDWLLRALGVAPERIPKDSEQAAALYRQHLAGTRTLIVLDNAATEAQVRPLLPGADRCLVLVTSRRRLKALDDAYTVSLDVLAAPEAVALLRAVAGPGRVPDDDPLAGEVAGLCGYLPLALRIAAALLRHRPAWSLEHLAGLLRAQHRLPALSDGDRDLSTVFGLSYDSLTADLQRVFRCLGLVPGPDLDAYAAGALTGTDPATATGQLEDLVDHNLLIAYAPGRYRLHDLVRAHARSLATTDPELDRNSALDRLLHYYAHTAQSASIPIARFPRPAPDGRAPAHAPTLTGPEAAQVWLRAERDNLEAAHTHAYTLDLHSHALALAAGLAEILRTDGPYTRALDLHQAAAEAAQRHGYPTAHASALTSLGGVRRLTGDLAGAADALSRALEIHHAVGDRHGEATTLAELGTVSLVTGDPAGAGDALSEALEIYRAIGQRHGEATALTELGAVRHLTGDPAGAADALSEALEIYRTIGHRTGKANALTYLGQVQRMTGDLPGATAALSEALEIHRETGHRRGEANALADLGTVRHLTGDLAGSGDALSEALEIYRTIGHRTGEANALTYLGIVKRTTGDLAGAAHALSQALEIYRTIGDRNNEAWALNPYAATIAATGDMPRALTLYEQALTMNRELNKPDDEAIALEGLGECHISTGHTEPGTSRLRQALEIYQRLGMAADTSRVQARLAELGEPI
jgi:DNA-binding SARP family transcriptional activator